MRVARARGFTLIELMIALVIIGILVLFAMPNFLQWIQNSKTRSVADSIQNGLRYAQEEAIRLSRVTTFTYTSASTSWAVDYIPNSIASTMDTAPHPLQTSPVGGLDNTVVTLGTTPTATPSVLAFNSLGRVFDGTGTAPYPALTGTATFNVTNPKGTRALRVLVTPSGSVRMCDPDKNFNADTSPDGC